MRAWQIKAVEENLDELSSSTNCSSELIIKVQSVIPIGKHEKAALEATSNSYDRSVQFYEMMMRKDNFYDPLVNALEQARQTGAVRILRDAKEKLEGLSEDQIGEPSPKKKRQEHYCTVPRSCTLNDLAFSEWVKPLVLPPEQCTYYIPRTLFYRTELDPIVFKSRPTKNHIFLFKDISKSDLAKLTGYEIVESIETQLSRVTAKLIIIKKDADFDWICKNTSKPVHLIQHESGSYFWIKSSDGLDSISQYLKEEGKFVDEEEMVSRFMSLQTSRPFIISDSPGMGKSLILARLAREVQKYSSNLCIFIVLQEFMQKIKLGKVNSSSSALKAIADYSSSYQNRKSKFNLVEMLNNLHNPVYLFLDGYDEVMPEKLDVLDSFLKNLQEVKNVKMIMTTRPHLRGRLESIFNELAYEITPFSETNQIDFLTRYWTDLHQAVEGESLRKYARKCLQALMTNLTDEEQEIAGIPLQCMMLAEVYVEYAKRASTMEDLDDCAVEPITFFDMFKKLVEFKMQRISTAAAKNSIVNKFISFFCKTSYEQNCVNAHVKLAIKLLFPEWIEKLNPILAGHDEIDETTLYSIGLVEKGPNGERFVHRTIAEYLLAEFLVKNFGKNAQCIRLLFGEILGRNGTTEKTRYQFWIELTYNDAYEELFGDSFFLKHPVIAYFINLHLKESGLKDLPDYPLQDEIHAEDICTAAKLSCCHDFEYTFDFVAKVLHSFEIGEELRDRYFKCLPILTVIQCNNIMLFKKVLNFTKHAFKVDLNYHAIESNDVCSHRYTPLHAAVREGKYNFVTYLVKRYGKKQVRKFKCLLHFCVFRSLTNTNDVIKEKILIMDMLVKEINRGWIEEKDRNGRTPLLMDLVHLDLLKGLLEHGANINECSNNHATVLHDAECFGKTDFMNRVRFALSNGFKLINQKDDDDNNTLLMLVIRHHGIDEDGLQTFIDAGADLNAVDGNGDSVLFYALEYSESVEVIMKLVQQGVDVNHRNVSGENATHKLMPNKRLCAYHTLLILKLLDSKGFHFLTTKVEFVRQMKIFASKLDCPWHWKRFLDLCRSSSL